MHLKLFNSFCFFSCLVSLNLYSSETLLSKDRLEIFNLNKEQIQEDTKKLKRDLINPISYTLSKIDQEGSNPLISTISINQPIFRSGGIYQSILYANALEKYSNLDIELQRKNMIKDAVKLLFEIHKINYTIKKQELLIANSTLNVLRQREQVLSGISDTSLLDNAILDSNTNKNILAELIHQKNELVNNFNTLASGAYQTFELPEFTLIEDKTYLDNNLNILKIKEDIVAKNHFSIVTMSKYLPSINFKYDYTKYHDYDNNINNNTINTNSINRDSIGLSLNIPFNFSSLSDIQSTRIEYLKSRLSLNTTILEEENFYKTILSKIHMINSKMSIANEDFKLYTSLLEDITQAANAGLNSFVDVEILVNSKKITSYDIQILELEQQIELLELYAMVRVGNVDTGKSNIIQINDSEPSVSSPIMDLSNKEEHKIDMANKEAARVATLRFNTRAPIEAKKEKVVSVKYFIQVGAFRRYEGAKITQRKFKLIFKDKYNVIIKKEMLTKKVINLVMISGFKSAKEAKNFRNNNNLSGSILVAE